MILTPEPAVADPPSESQDVTQAPVEPPPEQLDQAALTPLSEPDRGAVDELTPIPAELPAGLAVGTPVLAGAGDLVDDTARLIRYRGPGNLQDQEVLLCHVDPDAEGKLLAALATTTPTTTVEVEQQIHGRIPLDIEQQLAERVIKAAKSVNSRLKNGTDIPAHTVDNAAELTQALTQLAADQSTQPAIKQMAEHYLGHLQHIQQRIDTPIDQRPPYTGPGGKLDTVTAFETTATITVTETVPDPTQIPLGQLPTTVRAATRIHATLQQATGEVGWDGHTRSKATGQEYVIDLGEGYTAVYRPHLPIAGGKQAAFSQRGALEVTAPTGPGRAAELVDKLGALNLGNRPLSPQEAEWTYLRRQVIAQDLAQHAEVADALVEAPGLDAAMQQVLFSQRANQAIGLNEQQLHAFAATIESDAAHAALPAKVRLLREAVAHVTGHADGKALAATAGYQPVPQASGGGLTWSRFDVVGNTSLEKTLAGHRIHHNVSSSANLVSMYRTGVLASTERRAEMGLPAGLGMSEDADKGTGGAQSVFCRISSGTAAGGVSLLWDNPTTLLCRADWYAYNGDHYGAIDPTAHNYSAHALTRDPAKVAKFTAGNNEIMFRNGIDLLGPEGPDRVRVGNATHRQQILELLTVKGITHLKGRPIKDVITT